MRKGFTLIEVLATMVLLAIVLPVAMQGLSIALASATHARRTAEAASLAEMKLNDLLTQSVTAATGLSGDFSPQHPEYRWTYESAPVDYGATEVLLRVTWVERGQERVYTLCTITRESDTTSLGGLQ
jgi:prepilin-type N-terminal cleavage/methylation domain-containing protein